MSTLCSWPLSSQACEIGFLEADFQAVIAAFSSWQQDLLNRRGNTLITSPLRSAGISASLSSLFPLTTVEPRRFLVTPTSSRWVALFDNSYPHPDVSGTVSYLARVIGCRGVRATLVPEGGDQLPARIFELYGPTETDCLNYVSYGVCSI